MTSEGDEPQVDELTALPDPSAFYERFMQAQEKEFRDYEAASAEPGYTDRLRQAHAAYVYDEELRPGQLVQWLPHMRNQRMPAYGAPAVVVAILEDPQTHDGDGDMLPEPLDAVLGVLDGADTFVVFASSSRRFTSWSDHGSETGGLAAPTSA